MLILYVFTVYDHGGADSESPIWCALPVISPPRLAQIRPMPEWWFGGKEKPEVGVFARDLDQHTPMMRQCQPQYSCGLADHAPATYTASHTE
jgi:hypothetical protein